ncbi:hypothetical protein KCU91_g123, partial [Aureobasidium melanogenum]
MPVPVVTSSTRLKMEAILKTLVLRTPLTYVADHDTVVNAVSIGETCKRMPFTKRRFCNCDATRLRTSGVLETDSVGNENKVDPEDNDRAPASKSVGKLERVVEPVTNRRMRKDTQYEEANEEENGKDRYQGCVNNATSLEVDDNEDCQENKPHGSGNSASRVHATMLVNFCEYTTQSQWCGEWIATRKLAAAALAAYGILATKTIEKIRRYTLRPVCRKYRMILAWRFGGTGSSAFVNSGFDRLTNVDDVDMLEKEEYEFFSVIVTTCLSLPFSKLRLEQSRYDTNRKTNWQAQWVRKECVEV